MSKLRVLCLHGFTSNGTVHAFQVRKITKQLSSQFEFIFPDGPHEVPMERSDYAGADAWMDYVSSNSTAGHRAWWFAKDSGGPNGRGEFRGLEETLRYIGSIMEKQGPFHAIWGFSQGGCFAGMLMALLHDQQRDHPMRQHFPKEQELPKAGLFFSGFKSRFQQYESAYQHGIEVPTLHMMGELDKIVTIERSETLKTICKNAKTLKHGGGHDIPGSQEDQAVIVHFLQNSVGLRTSESL